MSFQSKRLTTALLGLALAAGVTTVYAAPTRTLLDKTGVRLTASGNVDVWGYRDYGLQGNGTKNVNAKDYPGRVFALQNIREVSGGTYHLLALDQNGTVWGWGKNSYGQAGCSTGSYAAIPCNVNFSANMGPVTQIAAGEYTSYALTAAGQVFAWGYNTYGQLGRGSNKPSYSALPLPIYLFGEQAKMIGAAYQGGYAITTDNHVWAWGNNKYSGMALPKSQSTAYLPTRALYLEQYADRIVYISGGDGWGEALLNDGTVIGWGKYAALGRNLTSGYSDMPQEIATEVRELHAGYNTSIAVKQDGTIITWGYGSDSTIHSKAPTMRVLYAAPAANNAVGEKAAIGGGKNHFFYEDTAGNLYGVGKNEYYKLDQSKSSGTVMWPGREIWFVFP